MHVPKPPIHNAVSPTEVRTDLIVIHLRGDIGVNRIEDWDTIASLIAPSNSGDNVAFVKDGHKLKRKSRGAWRGAFWHANISFSFRNPRGNIKVELRLNVTKYEAFLALHSASPNDDPNPPHPYPSKYDVLSRLTLDGNSNFVPEHIQGLTTTDRTTLFADALTMFRRDFSYSLRSGGVAVRDHNTPSSMMIRPRPGYPHRMTLNWSTWTVVRIENYVDFEVAHAIDVVRSAYMIDRARHDRVVVNRHAVQQVLTQPNVTELERKNGSVSYETRSNPHNRLCIYSKSPTTIRIEHRYIANTEDRHVLPVSTFQSDGMGGLVRWVESMQATVHNTIEAKRADIAQVRNSCPINGERLFLQLNAEASRFFNTVQQQTTWMSDLVELGSPAIDCDVRGYRPFIERMVEAGVFRRGSRGIRTHAHPDLQKYFDALRQIRENWQGQ